MHRVIQQTKRPKVLLLDVDGVILHHKHVLNKVSNNIVQYCAKELNIPFKDALHINQLLYTEYGHSYRGLRKVFHYHKPIHHYNTMIYNRHVIHDVLETNQDTHQYTQYMHMQKIILKCLHEDVPVYLFTNAPLLWCKTVLSASGLDKFIPDENILSCDHHVMLSETVGRYIECKERLNDPVFIFVEDSFKNLIPIIRDASWLPIYLSSNTSLCSDHIATVRDTQECAIFINGLLHNPK
jgi:FMN phosphatase YigB (HAD superfamily)